MDKEKEMGNCLKKLNIPGENQKEENKENEIVIENKEQKKDKEETKENEENMEIEEDEKDKKKGEENIKIVKEENKEDKKEIKENNQEKNENKEDNKKINNSEKDKAKEDNKDKNEDKKKEEKNENKEERKENKEEKKENKEKNKENKEEKKEEIKSQNKNEKKSNKEGKKEDAKNKEKESEDKKKKEKEKSKNKSKEEDIITKNIKPRGLNNIGATCYMNSVLQCLYHIFDLSNELLKLNKKNILKKELEKKMPMTFALLEVISELTFSKNSSMSPYKFKEAIGNNETFRYYEANDSKTLTLYVLDTLNRELNENKIKVENDSIINKLRNYNDPNAKDIVQLFNENYNSIIGDLFNGLKSTNFVCLNCKNCVKNYQIFNIVTCSVEKAFMHKYKKSGGKIKELKINIIDCFIVDEEKTVFNGDNQLYCEKCDKSCDGESFNKLCISPKILILFLDRGINNRFKCDVEFPEKLDINNYLEEKGKKYELIGTIEHLGPSGQSGHFIANCKHFDGNWYIFSDSSFQTTKKNYKKYGLPYLLFYRMED